MVMLQRRQTIVDIFCRSSKVIYFKEINQTIYINLHACFAISIKTVIFLSWTQIYIMNKSCAQHVLILAWILLLRGDVVGGNWSTKIVDIFQFCPDTCTLFAFTERTAPKCLALTFASPAHIQSNTLSFSYILELADTGNHYNFLSGPCSADFSFLTNLQEFPPHTGMSQAVGEIPVQTCVLYSDSRPQQ